MSTDNNRAFVLSTIRDLDLSAVDEATSGFEFVEPGAGGKGVDPPEVQLFELGQIQEGWGKCGEAGAAKIDLAQVAEAGDSDGESGDEGVSQVQFAEGGKAADGFGEGGEGIAG